MKRCSRCWQERPIEMFRRNCKARDGRAFQCRPCQRAYMASFWNARRFGGNREAVIERDGRRCIKCSLTEERHVELYGLGLTVDHIDGRGIYSQTPNHAPANLRTLCFDCHGRLEVNRLSRWPAALAARRRAMEIQEELHATGL